MLLGNFRSKTYSEYFSGEAALDSRYKSVSRRRAKETSLERVWATGGADDCRHGGRRPRARPDVPSGQAPGPEHFFSSNSRHRRAFPSLPAPPGASPGPPPVTAPRHSLRSRGDVSFFTYLPCTSAGLDTSFLVFLRDSILADDARPAAAAAAPAASLGPRARRPPPPPGPAPPPPRLSAACARPQAPPHVGGAQGARRRSLAGQLLPGSQPAPRHRRRPPAGAMVRPPPPGAATAAAAAYVR